jgi:hypothetical protein
MLGISSKAFSTARKEILQTLLTHMIEAGIRNVVHTLNEDVRHDIKQHIFSLPATRIPLLYSTYRRYTQVEVQILQVCAGCTGTCTQGMERTRKNRM